MKKIFLNIICILFIVVLAVCGKNFYQTEQYPLPDYKQVCTDHVCFYRFFSDDERAFYFYYLPKNERYKVKDVATTLMHLSTLTPYRNKEIDIHTIYLFSHIPNLEPFENMSENWGAHQIMNAARLSTPLYWVNSHITGNRNSFCGYNPETKSYDFYYENNGTNHKIIYYREPKEYICKEQGRYIPNNFLRY